MLDKSLLFREHEWVRDQLRKLNDSGAEARLDKILDLEFKRRKTRAETEDLQAVRKRINSAFGRLRNNGQWSNAEKGVRVLLAIPGINNFTFHGLSEHLKISSAWLNGSMKFTGQDLAYGLEKMFRDLARVTNAHEYAELASFPHAAPIRVGVFPENEDLPSVSEAAYSESVEDHELNEAYDEFTKTLLHIGEEVKRGFVDINAIEAELQENMLWIPNLPHESVPVAESEADNIPGPLQGELREFDFDPKPHWELGPALDIIDFERGVKLAGSRYYTLKGWGARLQRALISFFLEEARANGFSEVYVPYIVHGEMLYGAAQFPKFQDTVFALADDGKYLIPTAEVGIANLHRDEILEEGDLPLHYVAHSPCFRSEKASAGRDVRGIKRVHQFEKVEMFTFTTPGASYDELENITEHAEKICAKLEIPYRRLEIVTGDLGFSATKKYDIEMWAPGCGEWLEVSSCSNTEDFQARRAMLRYYPSGTRKTRYLHTLNGSGLATPRVMIAIMENYQRADGSIVIPDALRPYLGGADIIN